ncbi:conserved protein of unknown function [Nitrospira japonica]|uniref:Uncharacterized protein n=1 Tax=Nitrospira japonica TaxID=1325564 RepID=A0A1W1I4C8_9BACT|nr:hypothetical protein [Nitrospira japonica]SLM47868.1 conserved protein of unknown function [Nitrospira japonica]
MNPLDRSGSFTDEETVLLADGEFFRKKQRISAKIRTMLEASHVALRDELTRSRLLAPSDFDATHHQFVKGEHLESCPYQYLDCPKHFQGSDKYTFRTLVWWGHHVVFVWILEGRLVKQYKKNLVDRFHSVAGRHLELSTAPTLWEWKCGEGYTLPLTHDRKATVAAVVAERGFLKIGRYVPLGDARVRQGDLASLAREAFAALSPIVSS